MKIKYVTDDGEEFESLEEAEQYEDLLILHQRVSSDYTIGYLSMDTLRKIMKYVRGMYELQIRGIDSKQEEVGMHGDIIS